MQAMCRIFLSYATEEHDLAEHIANYLENNNLEALHAPRNIRNIMGKIDYDKEVIEVINDCCAFVLLLSRNSDASEDVKIELDHAVKFKKQIICLDVDDLEPENLSYILGMCSRLNWLERRDETLDRLVHDIKRINELTSDETAKPTIETNPIIKVPEPETKAEHEPEAGVEQKSEPAINIPDPELEIKRNKIIGGFLLAVIFIAIICVLPLVEHVDISPARIIQLAEKGTPAEIREAAKAGADFTITSGTLGLSDDLTTLFLAVNTNTPEAVRAITETGVDINAVGSKETGFTALMQASGGGELKVVEILIDADADVNIQNDEGLTALMVAAACNKPDVVKFLLNHGADRNIRDNSGRTAYDHAHEREDEGKDVDPSILHLLNPDEDKLGNSARERGIVVNVPENDSLNVRKRPNINSSVLARLNNGDIVRINREYKKPKTGTLWYNITDNKTGITGFVASKYVRKLD